MIGCSSFSLSLYIKLFQCNFSDQIALILIAILLMRLVFFFHPKEGNIGERKGEVMYGAYH